MTQPSDNGTVIEDNTKEDSLIDESSAAKEESTEALFFDVGEGEVLDEEATVPCATLSADRKTLTFSMRDAADVTGDVGTGPWVYNVSNTESGIIAPGGEKENVKTIEKVVFDPSFKNARPKNGSCWFNQMINLKKIDGIEYLNTSEMTNMYNMFAECSSLTELDVSGFDTSKVTGMNYMFSNCSKLTKLDLSVFKTSKVKNMSGMFYQCPGLKEVDLKNFDTSNVEMMAFMFYGCSGLSKVDVSGFKTSKVESIGSMFENSGITSIDISAFDASNVETMSRMFANCSKLKKVNMSGLNTTKNISLSGMFSGCSSLTSVDITGMDTSKVVSMTSMFEGCSSLPEVDLSGLDTSSVVTQVSYKSNSTPGLYPMPYGEMSGFNRMFAGCGELKTIYCEHKFQRKKNDQITLKLNEIDNTEMFSGCNKLVGAIAFDKNKTSEEYADPDKGYFTRKSKSADDTQKDTKDPEQVNNFVERMYTKALKRAAEDKGKNYWSSQLLEGKSDGAALARGFICSEEFKNKDMSNEEFVDTLYATFFDRPADEGGKANWMKELEDGRSRTGVLSGFVNSAEFGNLCEKFGIARGTLEEDGSSIYNEGVYNFVKRNYTKTLGRKGEIAGIEDWCHRVNTGQISMKEVAIQFLNSEEFLNKNTSNEEYVKVLYRTFMDREADAAGLDDWKGKLDRGEKTRDEVVNGFADSAEFANIMAKYK